MEVGNLDIKMTRDTSEGRGVIGRIDDMKEVSEKLDQARAEGQMKDEAAIHSKTQKAVEAVTKAVEKVGGGVEAVAKFGDRLFRGAETAVRKTVAESWQVVQGLGEDTRDVIAGSARAAIIGGKWVGIGVAVTIATPFVTAAIAIQSAGAGLVELGQRGAKGLSEARAKVNDAILTGVRSLAASVEAKALAGKKAEESRIDKIRGEHLNRIAFIRDNNLGVKAARLISDRLKN